MNQLHQEICGLRIGNFKAFAEPQQIPIRPLTLIYGANSAGKSSVIHSLLLANHALQNGNLEVHQTKLGGDSVDLGGFIQYVHKHDVQQRFELAVELEHEPFGDRIIGDCVGIITRTAVRFEIGLPVTKDKPSVATDSAQVWAVELWLNGSRFMRLERQEDGRLHSTSLNFDSPLLKAAIERLIDEQAHNYPQEGGNASLAALLWLGFDKSNDKEAREARDAELRAKEIHEANKQHLLNQFDEIKQVVERDISRVPFSTECFFPVSLVPEGDEGEYAYASRDDDPQNILGTLGDDYKKGPPLLARTLRFEIERLYKILRAIFTVRLKRMCYLGPLRCYPPRHLTGMHDQDPNWFPGGGQAWEMLRRNPNVLMRVNEWLTAPDRLAKSYTLVVRELSDVKQIASELQARLEDSLGRLTANPKASITTEVESALKALAASSKSVVLSEIILRDKFGTEVSHRDIGQGISQVLPVLVHAFASEKMVIAVEQPELHLHPALQAELGDVFIESALGERRNTFLLESHSEHLLLRIMRRIRETHDGTLPPGKFPIRPTDVAVLYVEPVGTRSILREMPLNERGELIKDWPGGFFEEGLREMLM